MLADGVFKNLAMRATVDKAPDEGSYTADFIEELKELSSLHFKALPATPAAAPTTPETQAAVMPKPSTPTKSAEEAPVPSV
jgi:hypothetical protein